MAVWFVLPRGSLALDWAGPAEALRIANLEALAGIDRKSKAAPPPPFTLNFCAPAPVEPSSVGVLIAGLAPLPERIDGPACLPV